MATYIVGDIQGCFKTFIDLLKVINLNKNDDTIYLLGDFLNRGPSSLAMMDFVYSNQNNIKVILGNHEVFALSLYYKAKFVSKSHTLQQLLEHKNANKWFDFLKQQPLIIKHENNYLVHAGILPQLSLEEALAKSHEISQLIQNNPTEFLSDFYEEHKYSIEDKMSLYEKNKVYLASFIFMRMCYNDFKVDNYYTGTLEDAPNYLIPWFKLRNDSQKVFFGHWAAIGYLNYNNYFALDSGCGWGKQLSCYCLESNKLIQVNNLDI